MKQHSIAPRTKTTYHRLTRAPVVVAGTAAAIVGSLAAAPTDAASGADMADQRAVSAAVASAGAASADRGGDRARNGRLTYFVYIHDLNEIFTIGPRGNGRQAADAQRKVRHDPDLVPERAPDRLDRRSPQPWRDLR